MNLFMAVQDRLKKKKEIMVRKRLVKKTMLYWLSFSKFLRNWLIYIHISTSVAFITKIDKVGRGEETGKCAMGRYQKQTEKLTKRKV